MPLSGANAPFNMTQAPGWGQIDDLPAVGTAIFPPDHEPAGTTPAAVATTDWSYATTAYLDDNGRQVNTLTYGAGDWLIDSTSARVRPSPPR